MFQTCKMQTLNRIVHPVQASATINVVISALSVSSRPLLRPRYEFPKPMHRRVVGCFAKYVLSLRTFSSSSEGLPEPRLPVVVQTEFLSIEEMQDSEWLHPTAFLKTYSAVVDVQKHCKLIFNYHREPLMLSGIGRKLWHSLVLLVFVNKLRGHDIASAITEDNLIVSSVYGTFALKDSLSEAYDGSKPFMGFKALDALFRSLMKKIYGEAVIVSLSADVRFWLDILQNPEDDRLCVYNAALLCPIGRASLSIKLQALIRREVNTEYFNLSPAKHNEILEGIPYADLPMEDIDEMHPFFKYWRAYGIERKAVLDQNETQSSQSLPQQTEAKIWTSQGKNYASYTIVGLHRNGVLHRILTKTMVQFAELFPARVYSLWEVVQVLHYHLPLFLPALQVLAVRHDVWGLLEMGQYWPRDELYNHAKPMSPFHAACLIHGTGSDDDSTVFVWGLPKETYNEDLRKIFSPYGLVLRTRIIQTKQHGFVTYASRASAKEAIIQLKGRELQGKMISVELKCLTPINQVDWRLGHYAHPQYYDHYSWAVQVDRNTSGTSGI